MCAPDSYDRLLTPHDRIESFAATRSFWLSRARAPPFLRVTITSRGTRNFHCSLDDEQRRRLRRRLSRAEEVEDEVASPRDNRCRGYLGEQERTKCTSLLFDAVQNLIAIVRWKNYGRRYFPRHLRGGVEGKFGFRFITKKFDGRRAGKGARLRGAAKRFRKIHSVKEYTGFRRGGTQWRVVER